MTEQGDDFERRPPCDIGAEQCALGGMLLAKRAIMDVEDILRGPDFYRPAHGVIYDVILDMYGRGEPVDPITLADELDRRGELARVGQRAYMHDLISAVPTAAHAGYYARIILEKARFRRLIEVGTRIVQIGYGGGDADEATERAHRELELATELSRVEPLQSSGELLTTVLDQLDKALDPGLTTGWRDLDDVYRLRGSKSIVVAARTGVGKSNMALNLAEHIGTTLLEPCLYISLEMPAEELMMRRIAARARVDLTRLMQHTLEDEDWKRIGKVSGEITESRLVIDDQPLVGLAQVKSRIRAMTRLGNKPRVVIVDLLSLMQEPVRTENRRVAIDALARGLKLIAREFGICVVSLVQINRGPEGRTDKRPLLSDLKESGGLEEHADDVIILHRDDYYETDGCARAGEIDVIIAKHRNGPRFTVTLANQAHYARMVDMAAA